MATEYPGLMLRGQRDAQRRRSVWEEIAGGLSDTFGSVWEKIKGTVSGIGEKIYSVGSKAANAVFNPESGIYKWIQNIATSPLAQAGVEAVGNAFGAPGAGAILGAAGNAHQAIGQGMYGRLGYNNNNAAAVSIPGGERRLQVDNAINNYPMNDYNNSADVTFPMATVESEEERRRRRASIPG